MRVWEDLTAGKLKDGADGALDIEALYYCTADEQSDFIADYYGIEKKALQLVEECGELVQAASKLFRTKNSGEIRIAKEHLAEEMADVRICIDGIAHLLELTEMADKWRRYKLRRELGRIENIEMDKSEGK